MGEIVEARGHIRGGIHLEQPRDRMVIEHVQEPSRLQ